MKKHGIVLKPGKEKILLQKHPWIFSGAIAGWPEHFTEGDIVPVYAADSCLLGHGYFNSQTSLAGRMLSFGDADPLSAVADHIKKAISLRQNLFDAETTAYRLINSEGDFLPGLIVDQYEKHLVLQIGTLGMEKLKPFIIEQLRQYAPSDAIYEKSTSSSRKEEGLKPFEGTLFGSAADLVQITENGHHFYISYKEGQKTGFFLDQREMRQLIGSLSKGRRLLNCFSYTGGFSVYAMQGGAKSADAVDISKKALDLAKQNMLLNNIDPRACGYICEDVFAFLEKSPALDYDLLILDPPAFAKKQKDVLTACRGYKEINYKALSKMPSESLLLTCSCSYHINEELFTKVIMQAACDAGREIQIIGKHRHAPDHPVSHLEGSYLKSLLLRVL